MFGCRLSSLNFSTTCYLKRFERKTFGTIGTETAGGMLGDSLVITNGNPWLTSTR
jgi:hypothetical protein